MKKGYGKNNSVKRIVLKIGTSVLVDREKKISIAKMADLAKQVRAARDAGIEAIIVSSGAIACGMETLGLVKKPKEIEKRQALASIGQVLLMKMYMEAFGYERLKVGQVLLTHEDIKNKDRCLNLMNTFSSLLDMDIVPIINENDALSFREIRFGDNDNLSALIAQITDTDLLLLLSDVDGLYERDPNRFPNASIIRLVRKVDEGIERLAGGTRSEQSTGGMVSKLEAAKKAANYGIATRIVRGDLENVVGRVLAGEEIGTLFLPERKMTRKKWWTAYAFKVRGRIWVDDGAEHAILHRGKSLLPSGVAKADGDFRRGECVEMTGGTGVVIARGITNYSSTDIHEIKGMKSVDIERRLGYKYADEVVHRDNMVVFQVEEKVVA